MITKAQYFGSKPKPLAHEANADRLLARVAILHKRAAEDGVYGYWIDPDTGSQISGSKGGSGDGGYRTPDSTTGAKSSTHRTGDGVDTFDPDRALCAWCVMHPEELDKLGLYMEDPRWTPGWCHLQQIKPASGKRVYIPSTSAPLAPALPGQRPLPFSIK